MPRAVYCGKCHKAAYRQWRESAHANSFREPFYTRNVNLLIEQKGIASTRHCEGCHNPVALLSGALTPNSQMDRSFDNDGITCMTCHAITRVKNTSGTGSYEMGVPAVLIRDDGTPATGEIDPAEVMKNLPQHRRAMMKDFYHTPEFCSVCHKASIPKMLNGYKWQRAFSVYDEWQQSSWSRETVLPYYSKKVQVTCQMCHMEREQLPKGDYGSSDGMLASHRWLGSNTAIPTYYHYQKQLEKTAEFLRRNRIAIDLFALRKVKGDSSQLIAPIDRSTFTLLRGETVIFDVVIQNRGIGHGLVPEQRDFYQCWVQFTATDSSGHTLFSSGYLNPNGSLEKEAHSYTNRLISKTGEELDHHEVWATKVKAFDHTLLPGRSEAVHYEFRIPQDAQGPITVTASVNYRKFRKSYTDWVLKENSHYPVVQMATRSLQLKLGLNQAEEEPSKYKDLLRWNNYGIALTDQQQFKRAIVAFQKELQLDPSYLDAYTNMAIAALDQNDYDSAQNYLAEVLDRKPNDPRALAYRAIVYRLQYRLDRAIEALKPLVELYPRLRQAHRELGYAYFLTHQYELAREQYEAVQQIDPDDLQTHRWLAPVYRALGMNALADREAAAYADHVIEPDYSYVGQNYLRSHPGVAYENVPYHVHGAPLAARNAATERLLRPAAVWPDKGSTR